MKKLSLITIFFCISILLNAQESEKNTSNFELGRGLNFSFNEGNYQFSFGGFIQPAFKNSKVKGQDSSNEFSAKRTFLILSGKAIKEKVSFLIQTDYSLSEPLLDAWVAYHPTSKITITVGQKQTFLNNREMTFREDKLQFTDRSLLSQTLSRTGREFGLFMESKFGNKFGIVPMAALTSGDGRNSFGVDSRDTDLGGLKIGGRLDLYPFGYFSEGNDNLSADLAHEQSLKFVVGAAISQNTGVSNANGEGHGNFLLYNANGLNNLPDYSQVYLDFLLKYQGFSFLGEYANASASGLNTTFIDATATQILAPQQISEYLLIGDSYNFQAGYVTAKGLSFDFRYESSKPEYETNLNSLMQDLNSFTFGLTKYFNNNNLKMQASITSIDNSNTNNQTVGEFLVQIVF
ncbi:MAG: OprO/OprP family phosphate-selective porin [Flavobacteriaceae bacterium]|nr:OprO/OprP family phosphate-selective porin [Flavobacteriaceae bacterium]